MERETSKSYTAKDKALSPDGEIALDSFLISRKLQASSIHVRQRPEIRFIVVQDRLGNYRAIMTHSSSLCGQYTAFAASKQLCTSICDEREKFSVGVTLFLYISMYRCVVIYFQRHVCTCLRGIAILTL